MSNAPLRGLLLRREQSDFTQVDLGKAIGCTQSHYRKFESGVVRLDLQRAAILAKMLGCRIDDLL